MKETEAKEILKNTFGDAFDDLQFQKFTRNLLKEYINRDSRPTVKNEFVSYIKEYIELGEYLDSEKQKIDIVKVILTKSSSLVHARTAQRNFVADYLKRKGIDAALVAFVSPGDADWRFSLVKLEYSLEEKEGMVVSRESLTPAKRWSFLVGKNEGSHTAQSRFLDLLTNEEKPILRELENAFDVEKVTNEFFEKYKDLFFRVKENLDKQIEKDNALKSEFTSKDISSVDFAKKTLGQIVFLYFLQKKGWFGVESSGEWGEGSKSFIRELFKRREKYGKNFFNDILEPLFYEALAQDRGNRSIYPRLNNTRMPFLNGGLFEPINDYDWQTTKINIPDSIFSNENNTKQGDIGDGVLDIFDRYNFTVNEDEPLEKEVAVDPEMLGKIFENLLEIKERKDKGSFYTPREIVHYMCRESLISYLMTETRNELPRKDIEMLIYKGISIFDNDITALQKTKGGKYKNDRYKLIMPKTIIDRAKELDDFLANIKVADPAVGSGAFPLGMINEIVSARRLLGIYTGSSQSVYDFKLHAISNSIHGVDIDPGAVEIAKLRLWLSLVVEEKKPHPLPNLDHRIMQGNSLLSEYEGIKLFDESVFTVNKSKGPEQKMLPLGKSEAEQKMEDLQDNIKSYVSESRPSPKSELKKRIDNLKWEFIEATLIEQGKKKSLKQIQELRHKNIKPFFIWELEFSEVFRDKGGFDVVIGNPPYVSATKHAKSNPEEREYLRNKYKDLHGAFDLYVVFLLRGLDLLNYNKVFSWIIPNKFLVSDYAKGVLERLEDQGLYATIDVSSYNVFNNVGVYPIILLGNNIRDKHIQFQINSLKDLEENRVKEFNNNFNYKTLRDFDIKIGSGLTGFQAKEVIPLIKDFYKNSSGRIPFAVSGSFDRYCIDTRTVRYMKTTYKSPLIKFDTAIISGNKWDFWKNEKIVIAGMTKRIEAFYSRTPLALGVGCYAIYEYGKFKPKCLLGLLNSKFITYYLRNKFKDKHLAGGYLAINKSTIEQLPLIEIPMVIQQEIEDIVDKIIPITLRSEYNAKKPLFEQKVLEKKIDQLVYELYGLTEEEIKIVEGNIEK